MSDEHEASGRVAAFAAVVDLAIEEAEDDSSRWYSGFSRGDVEQRVSRDYDVDVSTTTVHRALKDAAALGWVEDKRQDWDAGARAESYRSTPDDEIPEHA